MTRTKDKICNDYRKSNDSIRLDMFMQYRDLRDVFLEIDEETTPVNDREGKRNEMDRAHWAEISAKQGR
ncbi:MAG: hypothetical protein PVH87_17840 [Desulfobacteraceae bacterium]